MLFKTEGAAYTEAPKLDRAWFTLETTEGETELYRGQFAQDHTTSK